MATTNRYANGKIYRLVSNVDEEFYVGSTCSILAKRLYEHKKDAERGILPAYKHLNEVGWDNISIVLIEEYSCENKNQLERRERYWIETLKPTLNKTIPTRTVKEWYEDNKEKVREQAAKYRKDNAEKIREYHEKYYAENADKIREKGAKYRAENAEKSRERHAKYRAENADKIREKGAKYRAENAEKIREKKAKYYEQNKDKVKERFSTRVKCPHCDKEMRRDSISKHIKTQHPS